jgi:hypothetical protein
VKAGQILLDNRTAEGKGLSLQTAEGGRVEIILNDGRTENRWASDPGSIQPRRLKHVVVVVDGGPKIITFVMDGQLSDGGEHRQFGWGRFSPSLQGASGGATLRIAPGLDGDVLHLRVYDRYLRTSEAIGNFRAGL